LTPRNPPPFGNPAAIWYLTASHDLYVLHVLETNCVIAISNSFINYIYIGKIHLDKIKAAFKAAFIFR
jgi:hypothetical protein